ncbi:hypothetical protein TorRG33x02_100780 [Trema orientale]|uniref:DUF7722 domain-containing protein n=1 Tax=Trema orientale TaxID=63057 RepID=A0A2P5F8E4_TREOI|nr:hypothetical protein TorRG33x02_100780 [Trema orientale]
MALKWFLNYAFTLGHPENVEMTKGAKEKTQVISICKEEEYPDGFQLPLHYPSYNKADYEKMEEWKLDMLLKEYGITVKGSLEEKRKFAMGAFLWPDQM